MTSLAYVFASLMLSSALLVIQARNPVHSVLFLILVFFNLSALLLLVGLDFFALIFLVVYVGAIAVLFLFVVMMLNVKLVELNEKRLRLLPIGGMLAFLFVLEIAIVFSEDLVFSDIASGSYRDKSHQLVSTISPNLLDLSLLFETYNNIQAIGFILYTYSVLFFLLASIILLVAMIGAIVLTMHKTVAIKRQKVVQQNTREFQSTVRLFS